MVELNDVVRLGDDFSVVALDKEFFFLPNSSDGVTEEKLFALNKTAYFVVSCIDGKKSVEDIAKLLSEKTTTEKDLVEKDVLELMNNLLEKKLIMK